MASPKAALAAGKMFNAAEGARKYIGAAEYWRRWLLGKYSTPPKVAFGARKYMGVWELLKSRRSDARNLFLERAAHHENALCA